MIRALLPLLLLSPSVASAADRTIGLGSFDRLRIEGPFRVTVATGSPRATISGDARAIEQVEVRANGNTVVVRMGSGVWGEQPAATDQPLTVTLATPTLLAATVVGGADLTVARMKGQRVDVSATGSGTVKLGAVDADQLNLTVIGSAGIEAGGHAARARLLTNGPGRIDASGVVVDDLFVSMDGAGETAAQARVTAQVVNTGLGRVTITGNARCSVKAAAGGPVTCGPKL